MGLPAVMTSTTVRGLSGDGVGCVEQSEFGSAGTPSQSPWVRQAKAPASRRCSGGWISLVRHRVGHVAGDEPVAAISCGTYK